MGYTPTHCEITEAWRAGLMQYILPVSDGGLRCLQPIARVIDAALELVSKEQSATRR